MWGDGWCEWTRLPHHQWHSFHKRAEAEGECPVAMHLLGCSRQVNILITCRFNLWHFPAAGSLDQGSLTNMHFPATPTSCSMEFINAFSHPLRKHSSPKRNWDLMRKGTEDMIGSAPCGEAHERGGPKAETGCTIHVRAPQPTWGPLVSYRSKWLPLVRCTRRKGTCHSTQHTAHSTQHTAQSRLVD